MSVTDNPVVRFGALGGRAVGVVLCLIMSFAWFRVAFTADPSAFVTATLITIFVVPVVLLGGLASIAIDRTVGW